MNKEFELLYGQIPEENLDGEDIEEFDDSYYDLISSLVTPAAPEEPETMPWEMDDILFEDVFYDFTNPKYYPEDGFIYLNTTQKTLDNGSISHEVNYYSCGDFTENIYTILSGKFEYTETTNDIASVRTITEVLDRLPRQINITVYTDSQELIDAMDQLKAHPAEEDSISADYKELLYAMYYSNVTFSNNHTKDAFESWTKCLDYVQEREEEL